ncbi:MAG TPA: PLP-dependent aspartate aminotransferase family protein [Clostridiaceae bacterium]
MSVKEEGIKIETILVHGSKGFDETTGAVSFPIYQSATFRHPGLYETTGYDYSRLQNPTREELEKTIAKLEGGNEGLAFSSGMAAISTIFSFFKSGDNLIFSDDLYGGTYRLAEEIYKKLGISVTYIDTRNLKMVEEAIKTNTRAIFVETPTNPMMKVTDIKLIAELGHSKSLIVIIDNTFLTPYFQNPIKLGADIVVHSGTKYLGGHNDTLAGLLIVKDPSLAEQFRLIQKSVGAVLSPFDSWLILRGMKTLAIRLEREQESAFKVASFLKVNKNVENVYYVGLPDDEGYNISKLQARGFGGMISFRVKESSLVEKILKRIKVITFAESLGGVETLITYPMVQTHAAIPEEIRIKLGVDDRLLRLSIGLENAEDIIQDLEEAMFN